MTDRFFSMTTGAGAGAGSAWGGATESFGAGGGQGGFTILAHGGAPNHLVIHVDLDLAVFLWCHVSQQVTQIGRIKLAGLRGEPAGHVP